MKRTLLGAALATLVALPAAAAQRGNAVSARSHAVALKNIGITPKTLRVRRGDSVVWTWYDKQIRGWHNVTSYGRMRFRSSKTQLVGTYTVKLARKGTYFYHCTIHDAAMLGKIIVK